jgi:hypothetical protein
MSNKDAVVRHATHAAQTRQPAPVYKPATPYVIKQAGIGAYNTTMRNTDKKK